MNLGLAGLTSINEYSQRARHKFEWETLTDRGPRRFRTRGRMRIIVMGNRIVVTDTDDNVYEIEDFWKLDRKSQGEIESAF